jgi:cysteine-rich repeat protein
VGGVCGDGVLDVNEECDDGNDVNNDDCLDTCAAASCGDGFIRASNENCDDGNAVPSDGCGTMCEVELYYRCIGEGPSSCNPIRILFAPADPDSPAFRVSIEMVTGGSVSYFDARNDSPTLIELETNYDCVFTHPNFAYSNSATMGTVLRGFVDNGGNVVLGIATHYNPPHGLATTPITSNGYSPVMGGMVVAGPHAYAGNGATVLHTNVDAYGLDLIDTNVTLQGAGLADGTYGNGAIATAYRPDFKVVYVNGTGDPPFGPTGTWGRLIANACAAGFVQP